MFSTITEKTYDNKDNYIEAVCLSTDTKPTTGIQNGSMCLEMNTGKIYVFNEDASTWVELQ